MNYQTKVLRRYREYFPKKTLKLISKETGIHMSRVFRLFNGSEMKISEYESFEKVILQHTLSEGQIELIRRVEEFLLKTNYDDAEHFQIEIEHQLKKIEFKTKRHTLTQEVCMAAN